MHRILIKDIEDLKQKNQQIVDLQKRIDEFSEVKLLKEKRKQVFELNNKINELSTFDSKLIGDTIAKLMSEFEGILYHCVKDNSWLGNYDYLVEPKLDEKEFPQVYPNYKFKKIKCKNIFYKEEATLTFLPPSPFISSYDLSKAPEEINTSYIQYFIDFLYDKRSNNSLYKITKENLEIILQEFLLITKELQQKRKEEITRKKEERLLYKKRLEFEKSCMIDRKLIYNSLIYIINHYEDNITAMQKYEKDWSRSSQWSELYGYHHLIINDGINKVCFKTIVDHEGCYPDEEYCGVYVNMNKDTNICFFDLKKSIITIIKNYIYVDMFMSMIENLFDKKGNISADDIQQILALISNDKKVKRHVLEKEI